MIKKLFLGLGIGLFSFISFSYGENVSNELPGNFYQGNIYNTIGKNLNFSNSSGGNRIFDNSYGGVGAIFWNNGKLYFYRYIDSNTKSQGYFGGACKVYSSGGDLTLPVCTNENDFTETNSNEFYSLQGYNFTRYYTVGMADYYGMQLCIYNSNNQYYYCFSRQNLTGSLSIVGKQTDLTQYAQNSRFGIGETNNNIIINQQCPTIKQIMLNYGNNYNTGLCYNNTLYFNGQTMETIEKQDIFTIFGDYENYINRISIYRNNCGNTNTTQACQNAFSGEYKKYSIISNASNSNVDEKKIWNYCNMGLNYDPNTTTCVASGYIAEQPTAEERLNDLINMNTGIPTPNTTTTNQDNNVFNALCDPNDPTKCYGSGNVRDIFGSLESIYGKITGIFRERSGKNGIIPDYILWITMLTLVFTIILKK